MYTLLASESFIFVLVVIVVRAFALVSVLVHIASRYICRRRIRVDLHLRADALLLLPSLFFL